MEIKTFRAKTMPAALDLVRRELGPEAMVLHTREVHGSLLGRLFLGRHYEIAASDAPQGRADRVQPREDAAAAPRTAPLDNGVELSIHNRFDRGDASDETEAFHLRLPRRDVSSDAPLTSPEFPPAYQRQSEATPLDELQTLIAQLRARSSTPHQEAPPALFELYTELIDADIDEDVARGLINRLRDEPGVELAGPLAVRARMLDLLEADIRVAGPTVATPGAARVVALIGPTGVGKTTTIAKLAANFRLRENRRVGLITVDTYRIAAVEQLRTYAEIIDLPMKVVGTPREMREAVEEMRTFDIVLMDTAGRSPRDDVKIRELRAMVAEAAPQEVHLVLSATSSARSLAAAADNFAPVGVTSLLITKLDEATGLGNLVSLARASQLPFSYVTDGQNVPDDIAVADSKRLADLILNQNAQWAAART